MQSHEIMEQWLRLTAVSFVGEVLAIFATVALHAVRHALVTVGASKLTGAAADSYPQPTGQTEDNSLRFHLSLQFNYDV